MVDEAGMKKSPLSQAGLAQNIIFLTENLKQGLYKKAPLT